MFYNIFLLIFTLFISGCWEVQHPAKPRPITQHSTTQDANKGSPTWPWGLLSIPLAAVVYKLWPSKKNQDFPFTDNNAPMDWNNPRTLGPTGNYYATESTPFPAEYLDPDKAVLGADPKHYVEYYIKGDGSCWVRAWLRAALHQIFRNDQLFAYFTQQIQQSGPLLNNTPDERVKRAAEQTGQMVSLMQHLKGLPNDLKRLQLMNHQKVDYFLDTWFRALTAALQYQKSPEGIWPECLKIRTVTGYWHIPETLYEYFQLEIHTIIPQDHNINETRGLWILNTSDPFAKLPLLYSPQTEVICLLVHGNHYVNLYRIKDNQNPIPPLLDRPMQQHGNIIPWNAFSPELINDQTFQAILFKTEAWSENAALSDETIFAHMLYQRLQPHFTQWEQLKTSIQASKSFGEAFTTDNPIDALIAVVDYMQSHPAKMLPYNLFVAIWEEYLNRLADHRGIPKKETNRQEQALNHLLKGIQDTTDTQPSSSEGDTSSIPPMDWNNPRTLGPTGNYYATKPTPFPREYLDPDKAVLGADPEHYVEYYDKADGSCWVRAWLRAALHQIFRNDQLFAHFIQQIQQSGPLLNNTPDGSAKRAAAQIEQMVSLIQHLKGLPNDLKRLQLMNHQNVDYFLDTWFRALTAALQYKEGIIEAWQDRLKIGTAEGWYHIPIHLSDYFQVDVHSIAPEGHHSVDGDSLWLDSTPYPISKLPLFYTPQTEIICIVINGDHFVNLHRIKDDQHPTPLLNRLMQQYGSNIPWSAITTELISDPTFQSILLGVVAPMFKKLKITLYNRLQFTPSQWEQLKTTINNSKTYGEEFTKDGLIDALIVVVDYMQSHSTNMLPFSLFVATWKAYLNRLASHLGIPKEQTDRKEQALNHLLREQH